MLFLVVEDDADVQRALVRFLRIHFSAEVIAAGNVATGLHALKDHVFDLVVTDFQLPDGTGAEIIKAVRNLKRRTPLVLHSGALDDDLTGYDVDAYVHKPSVMSDLAVVCQKLLASFYDQHCPV
jgi:DNA-binding response OmpR family regulator